MWCTTVPRHCRVLLSISADPVMRITARAPPSNRKQGVSTKSMRPSHRPSICASIIVTNPSGPHNPANCGSAWQPSAASMSSTADDPPCPEQQDACAEAGSQLLQTAAPGAKGLRAGLVPQREQVMSCRVHYAGTQGTRQGTRQPGTTLPASAINATASAVLSQAAQHARLAEGGPLPVAGADLGRPASQPSSSRIQVSASTRRCGAHCSSTQQRLARPAVGLCWQFAPL